MRVYGLVLALLLGWPLAAAAQQGGTANYDQLLARAKRGDATVDFQALRLAFTETPQYMPYGSPTLRFKEAMLTAFKSDDCVKATEEAERVINIAFVDIDAHLVADECYRRMGQTESANAHRAVSLGLVRSIQRSGDGKSPRTAYIVITVGEEYSLLKVLGYQPGQQFLIQEGAHWYDRLEVKNVNTGDEKKIYFNIDRLRLKASHEPKDKKPPPAR
jgi:hypothetical protein